MNLVMVYSFFLYIAQFNLLICGWGFMHLSLWEILLSIFIFLQYLCLIMLALLGYLGLLLLKETIENCYNSFLKYLVEFTSECIWARYFMFWKIINYLFIYFNRKMPIQIIYFFLRFGTLYHANNWSISSRISNLRLRIAYINPLLLFWCLWDL